MARVDEQNWVLQEDGSYVRHAGHGGEGAGEESESATAAAVSLADELGVDLSTVEGTGADGRITVGDVRAAANGD